MNTEHQTSCDPAANTNNRKHQSAGGVDLNRRLYELAGENARSVSAGNLLLPNEALTPENLHDLFEIIGWDPGLDDETVFIGVRSRDGVSEDDLWAQVARYPSGFRILMEWYIRPEINLEEKLRFINEINVGFAGPSMSYLGIPMSKEGLCTPKPGVVIASTHLPAHHGLSFNQIVMGVVHHIQATLVTAGMAHNRGLLDESRWPMRYVEMARDTTNQCERVLEQLQEEEDSHAH